MDEHLANILNTAVKTGMLSAAELAELVDIHGLSEKGYALVCVIGLNCTNDQVSNTIDEYCRKYECRIMKWH